jgi:hypothetical protein
MIGLAGEGIRGGELCTRNMVEFNIKHQKDQLPAGLVVHQFLRSAEIKKILVISEDNNGMGISFQIVVPQGWYWPFSSVWRSTVPVAIREALVV